MFLLRSKSDRKLAQPFGNQDEYERYFKQCRYSVR